MGNVPAPAPSHPADPFLALDELLMVVLEALSRLEQRVTGTITAVADRSKRSFQRKVELGDLPPTGGAST
jgi:hypothetical protein